MTLPALVLPMVGALVIWSGDPPKCERLGEPFVKWATSADARRLHVPTPLDAAIVKVQKEREGATVVYVIEAKAGESRAMVRAAAYRCEVPK